MHFGRISICKKMFIIFPFTMGTAGIAGLFHCVKIASWVGKWLSFCGRLRGIEAFHTPGGICAYDCGGLFVCLVLLSVSPS